MRNKAKLESRLQALEKRRAKETEMDDQQPNMIRLTGLWEKGGILSGGLSPSAKLVIMPNRIKKSSSDPDYVAFLQAPTEGGQLKRARKPRREGYQQQELAFWQDKYDE